MRVYLRVPYPERGDAKRLGAWYDGERKSWYVPDGVNPAPFSGWMRSCIYLVFAKRKCWRCKRLMTVVAFGVPYTLDGEGEDDLGLGMPYADRLSILPRPLCTPREIRGYLEDNSGWHKGYSKTTEETHLMNHCEECGVLQGDFFLFEEPDSPFFTPSKESLEAMRFLRVEVPWVGGELTGMSTCDDVFMSWARAHGEDLDLGVVEPLIF